MNPPDKMKSPPTGATVKGALLNRLAESLPHIPSGIKSVDLRDRDGEWSLDLVVGLPGGAEVAIGWSRGDVFVDGYPVAFDVKIFPAICSRVYQLMQEVKP